MRTKRRSFIASVLGAAAALLGMRPAPARPLTMDVIREGARRAAKKGGQLDKHFVWVGDRWARIK